MNTLKILLVEDLEDQQKIFADSVKVFNQKNKEICAVSFEVAKNLFEAVNKIDGSFDGAIVDLMLGEEKEGGNTAVRKISETLIRLPIIVVTGWIDLVEDHPLIIHKRTRDSESYESDLYKLKRISDTGLTRILGGRGTVEKIFQDVFQENILPHIQKWEEYGEKDSDRTEKALLRHTLNHLLQFLNDDKNKYFPEEVYLYPPLSDKICTGSIVKPKDDVKPKDRKWYVVMNPPCDLVIRDNDRPKTDNIVLVEIEKEENIIGGKIEKKHKKLFSNEYNFYYHWLPKTNFFEGGILNFRKLSSLSIEEFNKNYEKPKIQISPSFVKDILARFSAYYARQGQPDIDIEQFLQISPN